MRKRNENVEIILERLEDHFDFDILDRSRYFLAFERFSEHSFHDGEYGFDLISLMILLLIRMIERFFVGNTRRFVYVFGFWRYQ
jgi:hypothetical protein